MRPSASPYVYSYSVTQNEYVNEMQAFLHLIEDPQIIKFLKVADSCYKIADNYTLAMVFSYFKRVKLHLEEYTKFNFYLALHLAHDMEEDEEESKFEIYPWALGRNWQCKLVVFIQCRDRLLQRMNYETLVSKQCCEQVMSIEPDHWAWRRRRPLHHSGATRFYMRDAADDGFPRGPDGPWHRCYKCHPPLISSRSDCLVPELYDNSDIFCHSAVDDVTLSFSVSSDSSSSSPDEPKPTKIKRLRIALTKTAEILADDIWLHGS